MASTKLRFKTMQDMEYYYFGQPHLPDEGPTPFMKTMAPVLQTTLGVWQAIYGRKVWSQINQESNTFMMIPRAPWNQSGWRVITTRAATSGGGVAENGAIPDTIKPTFATLYTLPKTIAHTFDVSELAEFIATIDDSLGDVKAVMREELGKHHAEMCNVYLNTLPAAADTANVGFEPLDRVIASYSEVNGCSISATYDNIYGLSRDTAATPWADAQVTHNSGTVRNLTLPLIDTTFANIWKAGGQPKVIQTGYDTLMAWQQLLQSEQRFMETGTVMPSYNGVKGPAEGFDAGFTVSTYNGVPIIPSKNSVADTISRIYLLDTDYMELRIAKPTQYMESLDMIALGRFGTESMFRTMGELICEFFAAQGKVRDLQ